MSSFILGSAKEEDQECEDDKMMASPLRSMESRLKQFEDNLGEFNLLVNSLHINPQLETS